MKKLILLLLISGGLSAQVVVPKSTTTFSNVNAVGSMTVGGNLKVGGAITSPTVYGSSAASSDLNVFSTSNSTRGVLRLNDKTAITTNTTSQNLFSVTGTLTASSGLGVSNLFNSYFNSGNATQHGTAFFSANSVASQTNITQANGLLTAFYHYNPFTIPVWQGIETGGAFVDGASAKITDCWGLAAHLPQCTNGGSVTTAAAIYIPSMANTGITNTYGLYQASVYPNVMAGALTVGTGTANIETSSIVSLRAYKGSSYTQLGEMSNGNANIWFNQTSPSTTNYALLGSGTGITQLNSLNDTRIGYNGNIYTRYNSGTIYHTLPTRIGSSTAPSATLDVTGTMSVSGTSTLTGAAKLTNTLNYVGNTTWNTNQTNTLTTGNTGTVAVLSDAVFPVQMGLYTNGNPANATTYYGGSFGYIGGTTTQGWAPIYMPYNCMLVGWTCNIRVTGTLASSQSITLSLNVDNSATQLSTAITATAVNQTFTATALNTNVNAGSYIEPKWLTPTWGTPPTSFYGTITLWFVRRQ